VLSKIEKINVQNTIKSDGIDKLINFFINDYEALIDDYSKETETDSAIERIQSLLKELNQEIPSRFTEQITNKLELLDKKLAQSKNKATSVYNYLPFKVGFQYLDNKGQYTITQLSPTSMTIKYEDNQIRHFNSAGSIVYRGEIHKSLKPRKYTSKLIWQLNQNKFSAHDLLNKVPNYERRTHCFQCKSDINSSCDLCYICGWYHCKVCDACGCNYINY